LSGFRRTQISSRLAVSLCAAFCILCFPIRLAWADTGQPELGSSEAPSVSRVTPSSGPKEGGTTVTIEGAGFSEATRVVFGSMDASSVSVVSDSEIVATSPSGEATVDVTVEGPGGRSDVVAQDAFTFGPTVSKILPAIGPAAGGTAAEIQGFNLAGALAVRFGSGEALRFTVNNSESITAMSPPLTGLSATVPVVVETAEGPSLAVALPDLLSTNVFVYGPEVDSVEPTNGPSAGGTLVTIRGKGFEAAWWPGLAPPFVRGVRFGPSFLSCPSFRPAWIEPCSPSEFTVVSDSEILAISPRGFGSVPIGVMTGGGASTTVSAPVFTYWNEASSDHREAVARQIGRNVTVRCRPARRPKLDLMCHAPLPGAAGPFPSAGGNALRISRDRRLYATGTAWFRGSRVSLALNGATKLIPGRYNLAVFGLSGSAPLRFAIRLHTSPAK
jgi:IPT/TIG domain